MKKLVDVFGFAVLLSFLSASVVTHAQKTNKLPQEFLPAPIKVVQLQHQKGKTVSRSPVKRLNTADGVLRVENISGKTIQHLRIELYGALAFQTPIILTYGQIDPGLDAKKTELKPGQHVFLSIEKNSFSPHLDRIGHQVSEQLATTRGQSHTSLVVFTDGTAWLDGMLHRQDPQDSLRWNVIREGALPDLITDSELFKPVRFTAVGFTPTPSYQCYRYDGFTYISCCGENQVHHLMSPDPFGNWEPITFSVECPGGGTCQWQKRVICGQGDGD